MAARNAKQRPVLRIDPAASTRTALTLVVPIAHAAVDELLRARHACNGQPTIDTACKLAPTLLVRPFTLDTVGWAELNFGGLECRVPTDEYQSNEKTRSLMPDAFV